MKTPKFSSGARTPTLSWPRSPALAPYVKIRHVQYTSVFRRGGEQARVARLISAFLCSPPTVWLARSHRSVGLGAHGAFRNDSPRGRRDWYSLDELVRRREVTRRCSFSSGGNVMSRRVMAMVVIGALALSVIVVAGLWRRRP